MVYRSHRADGQTPCIVIRCMLPWLACLPRMWLVLLVGTAASGGNAPFAAMAWWPEDLPLLLCLLCHSAFAAIATAVVLKPLEEASAVVQTTAEAGSGVQAAAAPAAVEPQQQVVYKTVKQLRMRSAAAYLPHPEKESYGGEDAHFVSNISGGAIGVADGESSF